MKKSLFAVAAVTAFAGAAQAQSSVTVYGILDVGYVGSNAKEVAAPGTANAGINVANTQTTKIVKNAFGAGNEQTSRLGFKGTEDLGGGSSAFFTVELGLTPTNSSLSGSTDKDAIQGTTQAGGSGVDNRQSFVGIKKNGLGQVAMGRQYTLIFNSGAATNPGQYNSIAGDVIYNAGSVYTADNNASGTNNSVGFTNRASNALTFSSEAVAGFKVNGMYALNNANSTQLATSSNSSGGGGNVNWNGWGVGLDYTWNKLFVTGAYQSFKSQLTNGVYASSGTLLNLNSTGPLAGQLSANGALLAPTMLSDKQMFAGATYDFGILKAYAQWVGRKVQNDVTSSLTIGNGTSATSVAAGQQLNRNAQQIGVRSYITPVIESWGSIGQGNYKTTEASANVRFVGWQLGSNYYLSKRTNLYAIYGQQQSTSGTPSTAGSGASANQYALGVRHTF